MKFTKKRGVALGIGILVLGVIVYGIWHIVTTDKQTLFVESFGVVSSVTQLLPIDADTKDAISAANDIAQSVAQTDNVTRTYLIMLQNNHELRPGGGFLGQYAIVKIKNGEVEKFLLEDANILDQRIIAKIPTPYPMKKKLSLKNWKFRDSNFSPDFPTNVEKAEYFYRLSGGREKFDGVMAVNTDVFSEVLKITGPLSAPGYPHITFTSEDGALRLQEVVERAYLGDDVPAESKQHRKDIMKSLGKEMVAKLAHVENIPKLVEFSREQLERKNIMLYFKDERLQEVVASVHWDGAVDVDWTGDYLYAVDANMGALKTDYYMTRKLDYFLDLTTDKPTATFTYTYKNNAPHGDWRTSDYHTYLRLYVPEGSNFLSREFVGSPYTQTEFGKTYFGVMVDVVIGTEVAGKIVYELPDRFKSDPYTLLVQKQSGVGDVPISLTIKTPKGEIRKEDVLTKDLIYELGEMESEE